MTLPVMTSLTGSVRHDWEKSMTMKSPLAAVHKEACVVIRREYWQLLP